MYNFITLQACVWVHIPLQVDRGKTLSTENHSGRWVIYHWWKHC